MVKLPKQWKHWLRLGHFKWRACDRKWGQRYPHRNGRNFRVAKHKWQIDDGGDFDRWGNSFGAEVSIPKTQAEFLGSIGLLEMLAKTRGER
jgi:hypothetical protein